jgi:hypothetical protein
MRAKTGPNFNSGQLTLLNISKHPQTSPDILALILALKALSAAYARSLL